MTSDINIIRFRIFFVDISVFSLLLSKQKQGNSIKFIYSVYMYIYKYTRIYIYLYKRTFICLKC